MHIFCLCTFWGLQIWYESQARACSVIVNAFLQKQGQRGKIGGGAAVTHSATNENSRKEL